MEDSDSEVESSITSIAEVFPSMMSLIPIDGCDATLKADGMESSSSNVPEYSSTNIKESDGTKLTEKLVSLPTSSYAGLPIDDSCGLWMDETVIPMEDSDEEVDSSVLSVDKVGINVIQNIISTEANDAKLKVASVTSVRDNNPEHSNTNIKESDNSKPSNEVVSLPTSSYAGLPLDESCGLWMDDTYMRIEDSDEEAEKYIASHDENCPITENIIPSEVTDGKHEAVGMVFRSDSVSEYSSTDIKESNNTKSFDKLATVPTSTYAGLPLDESCGLWMDESIIPMEDSDEEVENSGRLGDKKCISETIFISEASNAKQKVTDEASRKDSTCKYPITNIKELDNTESSDTLVSLPSISYAGLPLDESSGMWMDETIIPMEDSEEEVESSVCSVDKDCPSIENKAHHFAGQPAKDISFLAHKTGPSLKSDAIISSVAHQGVVQPLSKSGISSLTHCVFESAKSSVSSVEHQVFVQSQNNVSFVAHQLLSPSPRDELSSLVHQIPSTEATISSWSSPITHQVLNPTKPGISIVTHQVIKPPHSENPFSSVTHQVREISEPVVSFVSHQVQQTIVADPTSTNEISVEDNDDEINTNLVNISDEKRWSSVVAKNVDIGMHKPKKDSSLENVSQIKHLSNTNKPIVVYESIESVEEPNTVFLDEGFIKVKHKKKTNVNRSFKENINNTEEQQLTEEKLEGYVSKDSFWIDQHVFETAEGKYVESISKSTQMSESRHEITEISGNEIRENNDKEEGLKSECSTAENVHDMTKAGSKHENNSWCYIASQKTRSSLQEQPALFRQTNSLMHVTNKTEVVYDDPCKISFENKQEWTDDDGFQVVKAGKKARRSNSFQVVKKEESPVEDYSFQKRLPECKRDNDGHRSSYPAGVSALAYNLSQDSFWFAKHIFDDAEAKYFENKKSVLIMKDPVTKGFNNNDNGDDGNHGFRFLQDGSQYHEPDNHQEKESESTTRGRYFYSWSDETTYLSPSIPVVEHSSQLNMEIPADLVDYFSMEGLQAQTFQV
jgi:hypothetical protein